MDSLTINLSNLKEVAELSNDNKYLYFIRYLKGLNCADLINFTGRLDELDTKIYETGEKINLTMDIIIGVQKKIKNDTIKLILDDEDFIKQFSDAVMEKCEQKISEMINFAPGNAEAEKAKEHFLSLENKADL